MIHKANVAKETFFCTTECGNSPTVWSPYYGVGMQFEGTRKRQALGNGMHRNTVNDNTVTVCTVQSRTNAEREHVGYYRCFTSFTRFRRMFPFCFRKLKILHRSCTDPAQCTLLQGPWYPLQVCTSAHSSPPTEAECGNVWRTREKGILSAHRRPVAYQ